MVNSLDNWNRVHYHARMYIHVMQLFIHEYIHAHVGGRYKRLHEGSMCEEQQNILVADSVSSQQKKEKILTLGYLDKTWSCMSVEILIHSEFQHSMLYGF